MIILKNSWCWLLLADGAEDLTEATTGGFSARSHGAIGDAVAACARRKIPYSAITLRDPSGALWGMVRRHGDTPQKREGLDRWCPDGWRLVAARG